MFGDDNAPYRGGQPSRRTRIARTAQANQGKGAKRGREPVHREFIDVDSPVNEADLAAKAAAEAKYAVDKAYRTEKFGATDRAKNLFRMPNEDDFRLRDERNKADHIYEGVVEHARSTGTEPPLRRDWDAARPPIGSGTQGKSVRGVGNANRGGGDHTQA